MRDISITSSTTEVSAQYRTKANLLWFMGVPLFDVLLVFTFMKELGISTDCTTESIGAFIRLNWFMANREMLVWSIFLMFICSGVLFVWRLHTIVRQGVTKKVYLGSLVVVIPIVYSAFILLHFGFQCLNLSGLKF